MLKSSDTIYIAGHTGLVGSAIVRALKASGFKQLLLRTHEELELTNQYATHEFLRNTKPDVVILAAARVGGIHANMTYPAEFAYENLMIEANVIHGAYLAGVKRLLSIGSSCIYPRLAEQPIQESALMTGPLEPTNAPYGIAKIAGIFLADAYNKQYGTDYRSVMPTNAYGPEDSFDLETCHVLPALIRRFHEARKSDAESVMLWGSGTPLREFIHADDLARGCLHVLGLPKNPGLMNIGSGEEVSIAELARLIADIVGYRGTMVFDSSKPDGTPRKKLNTERILMSGWKPKISLKEGIQRTYEWYCAKE